VTVNGVHDSWALEQRAAAAGRTVEQQRGWERGYEQGQARAREIMSPMPAAGFAPAPEVRQLAAPAPVHATGAQAAWLRDTWGGSLSRLVPQADEAADLAAARAQADQHEFTYGSRPALAYFLNRARGAGTGPGTVLSGDTAEVLGRIRLANPDMPIQMVIGPDPVASQVGGVVTAPGRWPEATGDAGLAAETLGQLARRQ
jgi:hypothetical protein